MDLEGQIRPTRVQNLIGGGVRLCRMATPRIEKVRSRPTTARIPLGVRTRAHAYLRSIQ